MIYKKVFTIVDALHSLRPLSTWSIINEEVYENLRWKDENQTKPTKTELEAEIKKLQKEYDDKFYQLQRKEEYPPVEMYLDALVKNDQLAIQEYINTCLAVKNKYPKPE